MFRITKYFNVIFIEKYLETNILIILLYQYLIFFMISDDQSLNPYTLNP
jgi:hypothetical protein